MEHQQNISLDKTTEIRCKCGSIIFSEKLLLRKISKFLIGSSQDGLIPINVMVCSICNTILEETLPVQLRVESAEIVEDNYSNNDVNEDNNGSKIIQMY